MKKRLCCFDFDGTITTRDTLLEIIKFGFGRRAFVLGFLRFLPQLVLMKLHLYDNAKAKALVFTHFFGGMPLADFDDLCRRFAAHSHALIRSRASTYIARQVQDGAEVAIVSASVDNWVRPFFERYAKVKVLGTQVEVADGRLTGRFATRNCYGKEKVERIKSLLQGSREDYFIEAFGDSRGDWAMLQFADKGHYRAFEDKS